MRGLVLLCVAIMLTVTVVDAAAQNAAFPRPFCIPANFLVRERAFLRAEPSTQSLGVKVVPAGAQVIKLLQVRGETRTIGSNTGDIWYRVSYRDEYGRASEGYIWSHLLEVVGENNAARILIPQFPSTVEDRLGNLFELTGLRTDSQALLDTTPLREPLGHQLLAVQSSDSRIQLVWLPLIRQLRRVDDATVEVAMYDGELLNGIWVRSHPVKYATESPAEFILGEPTEGPSRRTLSLPHDSIQVLENDVAPEPRAAFQQMVNCYLSTFEETARLVEVTTQPGETQRGLFGYLVDGGGAYSRYVWSAHRELPLWPSGAENCQSRLNARPPAHSVLFAEMAALTVTNAFGDCGGRMVNVSQSDGTTVEGALISRDESHSGNWQYGANLVDDYVIVFTSYGADMLRLSGVTGLIFFD